MIVFDEKDLDWHIGVNVTLSKEWEEIEFIVDQLYAQMMGWA